MQAILAEKPDQARKYAAPFKSKKQQKHIDIEPCTTFPDGAVVVWAIGHLCEIAPPEAYNEEWSKWSLDTLPMIPEQFKHQIVKDKKGHFKAVKEQLQKADEIIIATDPAREGELIARLIIKLAGANGKPLKRLWCSSLTPDAIKKAFGNLRDGKQTEPLYEEALARSYSDWLVGMNTSRAYTLLMQQKGAEGVWSTGRVQTPLLCLIRQREQEIEKFKPEAFWEIVGEFITNDGQHYQGKLKLEKESRFKDKNQAEEVLQAVDKQTGRIDDIKIEQKTQRPPMLHSLSTLQAKLNKKYKLSPSKILETVQSLYEKGYTSYPRSEFQHLPEAEANDLPKVLDALGQIDNYTELIQNREKHSLVGDKRFVDDAKVGDHYAIIPTCQTPNLDSFTQDEKNVYDEIVKSIIAAHYSDHNYNQTTVKTKVNDYFFFSKGKQITNDGWKSVFGKQTEDESSDDQDDQQLPSSLEKGNAVQTSAQLKDGVTKPPKAYTEGQLITLMKTAGKTIDNDELEKELSLSKLGLGTEATRSGIIQTLKDRKYILIKKNKAETTAKGRMLVEAVKNTVLGSAEMTAQWELYLSKIGEREKQASPFIEQSKKLAKKLVSDAKEQSGSWNFTAYVQQMKDDKYLGKCPKCGSGVLERKGFYGCSAYKTKGCDFTMPGTLAGKKLSSANVNKLLSSGKTGLIKGFKNKNGKSFDAYLVWEDRTSGKFTFEFNNGRKRPGKKKKANYQT